MTTSGCFLKHEVLKTKTTSNNASLATGEKNILHSHEINVSLSEQQPQLDTMYFPPAKSFLCNLFVSSNSIIK